MNPVFAIITLVIKIASTVYCVNRAKELNRNSIGWGIFGFISPLIAIIWISFMKPKLNADL